MLRLAEFNMSENPGDRKYGEPGDQLKTAAEAEEPIFTKGELRIVSFYGGWETVYRAVNVIYAERIAWNMEAAARNIAVGYSQYNGAYPRTTFYDELLKAGGDAMQIRNKCNGDCSSGIMAVVNAAVGYEALPRDMYTETEDNALMKTGLFMRLSYHDFFAYQRGDILLKKGHTAVVIDDEDEQLYRYIATGNTWFRTLPDTTVASRIDVLKTGETVDLLRGAKNNWRMAFSPFTAWISLKYLKPARTVTVMEGASSWVRSEPSIDGRKIALITGPSYEMAAGQNDVMDERGVYWHPVQLHNGTTCGYISSKYTEVK